MHLPHIRTYRYLSGGGACGVICWKWSTRSISVINAIDIVQNRKPLSRSCIVIHKTHYEPCHIFGTFIGCTLWLYWTYKRNYVWNHFNKYYPDRCPSLHTIKFGAGYIRWHTKVWAINMDYICKENSLECAIIELERSKVIPNYQKLRYINLYILSGCQYLRGNHTHVYIFNTQYGHELTFTETLYKTLVIQKLVKCT